jgi:hypothetical protein
MVGGSWGWRELAALATQIGIRVEVEPGWWWHQCQPKLGLGGKMVGGSWGWRELAALATQIGIRVEVEPGWWWHQCQRKLGLAQEKSGWELRFTRVLGMDRSAHAAAFESLLFFTHPLK